MYCRDRELRESKQYIITRKKTYFVRSVKNNNNNNTVVTKRKKKKNESLVRRNLCDTDTTTGYRGRKKI